MPVLQQRPPVAESAADLEVLGTRLKIALLAEHVGQAHVHVAGSGKHRARLPLGGAQRAFIEPARLDRASARQPHVRQHYGRADLVREHAGCVQAGHRLGERVHRGAEVTGGPCRQAGEAGGCAAGEVVLRSRQR